MRHVCGIAIAAALGFVSFAPPVNAGMVNVPTIRPSVHVSSPKITGTVTGRTSVLTGSGTAGDPRVTGTMVGGTSGHTEATSAPRTYAVPTDVSGGITGAQASGGRPVATTTRWGTPRYRR